MIVVVDPRMLDATKMWPDYAYAQWEFQASRATIPCPSPRAVTGGV